MTHHLCPHGNEWIICKDCTATELSLAEAIDEFVTGLIRERNAFFSERHF